MTLNQFGIIEKSTLTFAPGAEAWAVSAEFLFDGVAAESMAADVCEEYKSELEVPVTCSENKVSYNIGFGGVDDADKLMAILQNECDEMELEYNGVDFDGPRGTPSELPTSCKVTDGESSLTLNIVYSDWTYTSTVTFSGSKSHEVELYSGNYGDRAEKQCAFDKAEEYRLPVMILGDGMLGQIMEAVTLPEMRDPSTFKKKEWATDGTGFGKDRRIVNSLYIVPDELEAMNHKLQKVYDTMCENETKCEEYLTEDAEIILTAYGTVARIAKSAVDILREQGIKAGLIRPITLYPFPSANIKKIADQASVKEIIAVELSMGQYIEDVKLNVEGKKEVKFYGRSGGNVMSPEDIVDFVKGEVK